MRSVQVLLSHSKREWCAAELPNRITLECWYLCRCLISLLYTSKKIRSLICIHICLRELQQGGPHVSSRISAVVWFGLGIPDVVRQLFSLCRSKLSPCSSSSSSSSSVRKTPCPFLISINYIFPTLFYCEFACLPNQELPGRLSFSYRDRLTTRNYQKLRLHQTRLVVLA